MSLAIAAAIAGCVPAVGAGGGGGGGEPSGSGVITAHGSLVSDSTDGVRGTYIKRDNFLSAVTVNGVRAKAIGSGDATIKLWDPDTMTVIESHPITLVAGEWVAVALDTPYELDGGVGVIVSVQPVSGSLDFARAAISGLTIASDFTVQGRFTNTVNGAPTGTDASTIYGICDIIYE